MGLAGGVDREETVLAFAIAGRFNAINGAEGEVEQQLGTLRADVGGDAFEDVADAGQRRGLDQRVPSGVRQRPDALLHLSGSRDGGRLAERPDDHPVT